MVFGQNLEILTSAKNDMKQKHNYISQGEQNGINFSSIAPSSEEFMPAEIVLWFLAWKMTHYKLVGKHWKTQLESDHNKQQIHENTTELSNSYSEVL